LIAAEHIFKERMLQF